MRLRPGQYVMFTLSASEQEELGRIIRETSTNSQMWISYLKDNSVVCSPLSRVITLRRLTKKELFLINLKGDSL